jgi:hypothetical protein
VSWGREIAFCAAVLAGCAMGGGGNERRDAGAIPDAQDEDAPSAPSCAACDPDATCDESSGVAVCTCPAGYSGDGTTCEDLDECALGTSGCAANAHCENTDGWFTCSCNPGFTGDGTVCDDTDECEDGTAECAEAAVCTNTPGTYLCGCPEGYVGDGTTCTDVNECADGSAGCDGLARCDNAVGSFTCTCIAGYEGDGFTCDDADECAAGTAGCDTHATCTNTVGSYDCRCATGWTGDGTSCSDVNECTAGTDDCDVNATCTNSLGSFTCRCNTGYTGDGRTCAPVCTLRETFERGTGWPWTPWVAQAAPAGTLSSAIRHDGSWALTDAGWHYRTDVSVGAIGDRLDAWVYTAGGTGRIYLGFGASASGAKSLIIAPNTDALIFQDNAGWGYSVVATTPQTYATGTWYRVEVEFRAGNQVLGNLYSASGVLVRSVLHTYTSSTSGGIAIRGFDGLVVDTIRLCR